MERWWGNLEQHWQGALPDSVEAVTRFTESMPWKGRHPVVEVVTTTEAKGMRLTKAAMAAVEAHLHRRPGLEKWSVPRRSSGNDVFFRVPERRQRLGRRLDPGAAGRARPVG